MQRVIVITIVALVSLYDDEKWFNSSSPSGITDAQIVPEHISCAKWFKKRINHEFACDFYYECVDDFPQLRQCPPNTPEFSIRKQLCVKHSDSITCKTFRNAKAIRDIMRSYDVHSQNRRINHHSSDISSNYSTTIVTTLQSTNNTVQQFNNDINKTAIAMLDESNTTNNNTNNTGITSIILPTNDTTPHMLVFGGIIASVFFLVLALICFTCQTEFRNIVTPRIVTPHIIVREDNANRLFNVYGDDKDHRNSNNESFAHGSRRINYDSALNNTNSSGLSGHDMPGPSYRFTSLPKNEAPPSFINTNEKMTNLTMTN